MITFHYGAMRAGKSKDIVERYNHKPDSVVLFSTISDTLSSRSYPSIKIPCVKSAGVDFISYHHAHPEYDTFLIDECQFLTRNQVLQIIRLFDVNIHVYGLRTRMDGEPFPSSALLLSHADFTHEVYSECETEGCHHNATMNVLYDSDGNRMWKWANETEIEDSRWKSVCPRCFFGG